MNRFASLYDQLEQAPFDAARVAVLATYFREASKDDAAWALYFLLGKRIRRTVSSSNLRDWAEAVTAWPSWMLDECQSAVGDVGEMIHLLLPASCQERHYSLRELVETILIPLEVLPKEQAGLSVKRLWKEMDGTERLLLHQLLSGGARFAVTFDLIAQSLAELASVPLSVMCFRLSRFSDAVPSSMDTLLRNESFGDAAGRPYQFQKGSPLQDSLVALSTLDDWIVEWKWEGVRVQVVIREGEVCLWSRDGTVLNGPFPEIEAVIRRGRDGIVIDGVLVARDGRNPGPFERLLRRLKNGAREGDAGVVLMAFDLLELDGVDIRSKALVERRRLLEELLSGMADRGQLRSNIVNQLQQGDLFDSNSVTTAVPLVQISGALDFVGADGLEELRRSARQNGGDGLVLKRSDSTYGGEEQRDVWWNLKSDPYRVSAVLTAAQFGSGKKADVYVEYSLAVWMDGALVTVAKVSGGLTSAEELELDQFIRSNIQGRHGPVRIVRPEQVFELHYEGVLASPRSRAGLILRGARIVCWNREKDVSQADLIDVLPV